MLITISEELGQIGAGQARSCASRSYGPPDKKGLRARKDHTGLCTVTRIEILPATKINPPTFWAWYKYCQPSQSRSRPLSLPSIHNFDSAIHVHQSLSFSNLNPLGFAFQSSHLAFLTLDISKMPPKAAEKKPSTGGKAPAGKAPADKKEAGKKTAAAPSGEKKKRGKTRKETYSSYIYKGMFLTGASCRAPNSSNLASFHL